MTMSLTGPDFAHLNPKAALAQTTQRLTDLRSQLQTLLQTSTITFASLVKPLENMANDLHHWWAPINHLNAVMNDAAWRDDFADAELQLADYHSELSQHAELAKAFQTLKDSSSYDKLSEAEQRIIVLYLRDFRLSGVNLPEKAKKTYAKLQRELCELGTQFENHVLDATRVWSHMVTDKEELSGVPEHTLTAAWQADKQAWILTTDFPCYYAIITYADNQALRKTLYEAYVTRASDEGPHDKAYDNSSVMVGITNKRRELAELLDFEDYRALSIATKMAENVDIVTNFLQDLALKARPKAQAEFKALSEFAKKHLELETLMPWDIAYASEKLRAHTFSFDSEQIRQYFPEPKVLKGLFDTIETLFNVNITLCSGMSTWHPDVKTYQIMNAQGECIAGFYLDLYARKNKRSGAWMDDCQGRYRLNQDTLQLPIAFLTTNFTPPQDNKPALLTHDEVVTLFHEMGHGLQHMLTQMDLLTISGINEVEWDAVELPSQWLENFCWTDEGLLRCSAHIDTGEPLPLALRQQLLAAKQFQAGMQLVRQLQFALFDWRLHALPTPVSSQQIQTLWDTVYQEVAVTPQLPYQRFAHQFSHIFAGGYGAGYYSYKWAEVLACDAFAAFEEAPTRTAELGLRFRDTILALGGSKPAAEIYRQFRGRDATLEALLAQEGL